MLEGGTARAALRNLFRSALFRVAAQQRDLTMTRLLWLRVVDQESLNTLCKKLRIARRH